MNGVKYLERLCAGNQYKFMGRDGLEEADSQFCESSYRRRTFGAVIKTPCTLSMQIFATSLCLRPHHSVRPRNNASGASAKTLTSCLSHESIFVAPETRSRKAQRMRRRALQGAMHYEEPSMD
jgi:hypothetical protein